MSGRKAAERRAKEMLLLHELTAATADVELGDVSSDEEHATPQHNAFAFGDSDSESESEIETEATADPTPAAEPTVPAVANELDEEQLASCAAAKMALKAKIVDLIDFYFSAENLKTDAFLRKQMKKNQGRVQVATVRGFNKLKRLTRSKEAVVDAIRASKHASVSCCGKFIVPSAGRDCQAELFSRAAAKSSKAKGKGNGRGKSKGRRRKGAKKTETDQPAVVAAHMATPAAAPEIDEAEAFRRTQGSGSEGSGRKKREQRRGVPRGGNCATDAARGRQGQLHPNSSSRQRRPSGLRAPRGTGGGEADRAAVPAKRYRADSKKGDCARRVWPRYRAGREGCARAVSCREQGKRLPQAGESMERRSSSNPDARGTRASSFRRRLGPASRSAAANCCEAE